MHIPIDLRSRVHHLTFGLLDEKFTPVKHLLRIPLSSGSVETIEPLTEHTAKTLKVLDVVRLTALFLGVLSLPPGLDITNMPHEATWITIHKAADDWSSVLPQDVSDAMHNKTVVELINQTIWIQIKGKQPKPMIELIPQITLALYLSKSDTRQKSDVLRSRFQKATQLNPAKCELSGDELAVDVMHIIAFEMGSSFLYALLMEVKKQGDHLYFLLEKRPTASPTQPREPIIGDASLFWLSGFLERETLLPKDLINTVRNLYIAAKDLHWIRSKNYGILLTTNPPTWLSPIHTVHSAVSFVGSCSNANIPTPSPRSIVRDDIYQTERFFTQSLGDALTLFMAFGAPAIRNDIDNFTRKLLAVKHTDDASDPRGQKRRRNVPEDSVRNSRRKTQEHGNHSASGSGASAEEAARPSRSHRGSGGSHSATDDRGSAQGAASTSGSMSTSSSGEMADRSGLSSTGSQASCNTESTVTDGGDAAGNESIVTQGHSGLSHIFTLLHPLQFEQGEDGEDSLTEASKEILRELFDVREPSEDEIERKSQLEEYAAACVFMLANWYSYN